MKRKLDKELNKEYKAFSRDHDQLRESLMDSLPDRLPAKTICIRKFIRDTIMKSSITKIAAAGVMIIVVLIGINEFGGSIDGASVAFAEIKKAVNEMRLMHKTIQTNRDGEEHYTERWYCFEPKSILSTYTANGKCYKIGSMDYDTMENVVYNPDSDVVRILWRVDVSSDFFPIAPWSVVGDYIEEYLQQDAGVSHEKGTYEGSDVDIYYFSIPRNFRGERVEAEFIVNRNSHLPILYKSKFRTPGGQLRSDQVISFDFPENGPKDIYDLGVPRTTKVVYDLESEKRLDRKMELLKDKAVCEERFREIYRLREGQVLRHIPPSLAEARIKIDQLSRSLRQLEREGSQIMPSVAAGERERKSNEAHFTMLRWDGEVIIVGESRPVFGKDGVSLGTAFERIIGMSAFEYNIPDNLLAIKIPGDWIVKKGSSKEQQLRAFETIVQDHTERQIRFEKRPIERDVIVARGKFRFKPLTGTYDDSWIHVYSDKLDPDERGGGGTYSLDRFLTQRLAETQLKQHVVNLTE